MPDEVFATSVSLAMAEPQTGNHADLLGIEDRIDEIVSQFSIAAIAVDGIFCNDKTTKDWFYDEVMYKHR